MPHRYRLIVDMAPTGVLLVDLAGRIVLANVLAEEIFGYGHRELIGVNVDQLMPAEFRHEHARLRSGFADQSSHRAMAGRELPAERRDGTRITIEVGLSVLGEGRDRFLLANVVDVTARVNTSRALRDSDARFRQLADAILEVFWLTDLARTEFTYVSPAYARVWGRTPEGLRARASEWLDSVVADDRPRVDEALSAHGGNGFEIEYRIRRGDGRIRWIRDRAFPVKDETGLVTGLAGVAEDITERRQLEHQVRQASHTRLVGQLAGGVAHEYNNLLTVMTGVTELLRVECLDKPRALDLVDRLEGATTRARDLTAQLLAFGQQDVLTPRRVDLNQVVTDSRLLLQHLLGEGVSVEAKLAPRPMMVTIDVARWSQVLANLALRAQPQLGTGGRFLLATMEADLGVSVTSNGVALPAGRHVCLVVTDTGTALTPSEREHIFEPAFDPGGLGLGLAAVKGIVEQSGGRIRVDSAPGRGNRFMIAVPETPGGAEPEPLPAPAPVAAASGTILLVEDEPEVRAIAAEFLEIEGFTVIQAVNGDHALKVIAQLGVAPRLMITDVVMPGADGREVAEALTARFPGTPVLFTSGYTDDVVVRRGVSQAEVSFLAKPYTSSTLMAKVREALASREG